MTLPILIILKNYLFNYIEALKLTDEKIELLISLSDYDIELNTVYEYLDKISVTQFRVMKKLNKKHKF